MILVIGSEKGGCGKSTLALNLALMSAIEGYDTLVIDADVQGSCNDFSIQRDEMGITPRLQVNMKKGNNLHREIRDLKGRYGRIIVDTGGRDSLELRSALLVADKCLIPVQPTQLDLWTIEKIFSVVSEAEGLNDNLKPLAVITRAHTNQLVTTSRDATSFLSQYPNVHLCKTVIYERLAWQKSIPEGKSVVEMRPNKASNELKLLYGEIYG